MYKMKIIIKFVGISGNDFIKQDYSKKMEIELSDNATVKDVFEYFNIPLEKGYVVIIDNKIAKKIDLLTNGMVVTLTQTVYGG